MLDQPAIKGLKQLKNGQYATGHSVVIYGDPSPEVMQIAAKMEGGHI